MSKTIIITGASDGIGKAAAEEFHRLGHRVVLIGRSPDKTKAAAEAINAPYYVADFSDLSQVRTLAEKLEQEYQQIDVLALNAGGIFANRVITTDGFEQTFQVNHLAHFLLVELLMKTLQRSNTTIIATSSAANGMNKIDLDDLNAEAGYNKWTVYGNAKLMNILFVRELNHRFGNQGINAASFHPGVVSTSFSRELSAPLKFLFSSKISRLFGIVTPGEGADTMVWLATSTPGVDWKPGEYYAKRTQKRAAGTAYDPTLAKNLWEKSQNLVSSKPIGKVKVSSPRS